MKFSIRDLLWLTVVVALAVGWGLDRRRMNVIDEGKKVIEEVKELYREEDRRHPRSIVPASSAPAPNPPKP